MKFLGTIAVSLALASVAGAQDVVSAPGAILRGLDKVSGETTDIELSGGEAQDYGRLTVTLSECRYPAENPSSEAFAHLTIADSATGTVVFDGWMIASSPALSALDDPRYDVWVLRCMSS